MDCHRLEIAAELRAEPSLPDFVAVYTEWEAGGFAAAALAGAVERCVASGSLSRDHADQFRTAGYLEGGLPLGPDLLFDRYRGPLPWVLQLGWGRGNGLDGALDPADVAGAGELFRATAASVPADEYRASLESILDEPLVIDALSAARHHDIGKTGVWPAIDRPGIYRREHACLVFRSQTTTLVTDPRMLATDWTTNFGRRPAERAGPTALAVDGILVTHGHSDHWHLPSILHAARVDTTPVVVPQGKPNLLATDDLSQALALAGQQVFAPAWWTSLTIGDFEIDVLPFYGEQPTRSAPGAEPALRNWGNCYRVSCPEFSAIVLVDSGVDPLGNMIDVMRRSAEERGPVDVVLSCCARFPEGLNLGLPAYAFTLPGARIEQIARERAEGRGSIITLGPDGLAEACEAAGARSFLPYAHGFRGLGIASVSAEGGATDALATDQVAAAIAARRGRTQVHPWSPGDAALVDDRELRIRRHSLNHR